MPELVALYARADLCLTTPLIDGMNLVAKEYIVAKDRSVANVKPGILVLSELAGASQELFDAVYVNPYDEDQVAHSIFYSLELLHDCDEESQWGLTSRMRQAVMKHDVVSWTEDMLSQVDAAGDPSNIIGMATTNVMPLRDKVANEFAAEQPGTKLL